MISESFIEELRLRVPLTETVRRRVKLERSGREWVGLCPFHTERTPSFHVYPGHFHCYGCNTNGDVIDFVRRTQGLEFQDAVEQLAKEAGMELPGTPAEQEHKALLDEAEAKAARWSAALWNSRGSAALTYLRARGLRDQTLREFRVGWADKTAEPLFRNRIIFPIHNARGKVVSFCGRVLTDEHPKYVNGPETPIYSKGALLYGLYTSRQLMLGEQMIVEGPIDVLALQQAKLPAAAPLGTALTAAQLLEAWRFHGRPILAFDGDAAGHTATKRALEQALPHLTPERSLRILELPIGQDPASLLQTDPAWALTATSNLKPLDQALFETIRSQFDLFTTESRAACLAALDVSAKKIRHRALAFELSRSLRTLFYQRPEKKGWATATAKPGRSLPPLTALSGQMRALDEQIAEARLLASEGPNEERLWTMIQCLEAERERTKIEGVEPNDSSDPG